MLISIARLSDAKKYSEKQPLRPPAAASSPIMGAFLGAPAPYYSESVAAVRCI